MTVQEFIAAFEANCHRLKDDQRAQFSSVLFAVDASWIEEIWERLDKRILDADRDASRRSFTLATVRNIISEVRREKDATSAPDKSAGCERCNGTGLMPVYGSYIESDGGRSFLPWSVSPESVPPVVYKLVFLCRCGRFSPQRDGVPMATREVQDGWAANYRPFLMWEKEATAGVLTWRSDMRAEACCIGKLLKAAGMADTEQFRQVSERARRLGVTRKEASDE